MQSRAFGVHARGYNDFHDVPAPIFHEINAAMMACHNVPDYAHVFEKFSEYLTNTSREHTSTPQSTRFGGAFILVLSCA